VPCAELQRHWGRGGGDLLFGYHALRLSVVAVLEQASQTAEF